MSIKDKRQSTIITEEIKLIIFDNISTLSRSGVENEVESCTLQNWTLDLRRRGIAVLFIHHGNKSGGKEEPVGEDILDTVIQLKRQMITNLKKGLFLRSTLTRQEDSW